MTHRIFQIGFNKCGTRSLFVFFKRNGLTGIHYDNGRLASTIFRNLSEKRPPIEGYEQFNFLSDMEYVTPIASLEAFKLFDVLAEAYPEARFILNTREREGWVKSRLKHAEGAYKTKWMNGLKLADEDALADHWRADFDRHHARVRDYFADQPDRLIEFDLDRDGADVLMRAAPGYDFKVKQLPLVGKTA
jgi:hypothetical protein